MLSILHLALGTEPSSQARTLSRSLDPQRSHGSDTRPAAQDRGERGAGTHWLRPQLQRYLRTLASQVIPAAGRNLSFLFCQVASCSTYTLLGSRGLRVERERRLNTRTQGRGHCWEGRGLPASGHTPPWIPGLDFPVSHAHSPLARNCARRQVAVGRKTGLSSVSGGSKMSPVTGFGTLAVPKNLGSITEAQGPLSPH